MAIHHAFVRRKNSQRTEKSLVETRRSLPDRHGGVDPLCYARFALSNDSGMMKDRMRFILLHRMVAQNLNVTVTECVSYCRWSIEKTGTGGAE